MQYPYDDQYMVYNHNLHRYVLTENCVHDELGEKFDLDTTGDTNPSTLPDRILKRISGTVYRYLYENVWNRDTLEYYLAKIPSLRETIKEMLTEQTLYVLRNGFIEDYSGVNISKGTAMDINQLRGRAKVAPAVEDLAYQTVPELGHSLKFAGPLPIIPANAFRRGY